MSDSIPREDLVLLMDVLAFAAEKHRHQRRKDVEASPYINHPIALASILCNEGGITDPEVICGALLHDTVEDTDTTPEELEGRFGPTIRDIVMDVTDDKSLSKPERKQKQIEHAAHISPKAKLAKLADKIANLRDIASSPPDGWDEERKRMALMYKVYGIHF
ncbi:phosphohydrolase [Solemya velum gill symbiont]|uniref:HD domain-containing protein n=1 Tax=Solemya velum gill symbiont TaxID=2340 RepID=UPI0009981506|nr:HD domain-containing protein [Solemya velum gill symbiont]OOZ74461.1 phosphohydrolase [Solemya velum gill symbiont]